jgi:hypothetical protein
MVAAFYGEVSSPRNAVPRLSEAVGPGCAPPSATDPVLTSATRDTLLGALADGGPVALDTLVALLPDHPRPLCAVIALVDTGAALMDLASAFDASCRVWRSPAPRL